MEKTAFGETFDNNRSLVTFINNNKLTKEDIITIYEHRGAIYLLYYK